MNSAIREVSMFERLMIWLTVRRWNRLISSTLCQMHEVGVIDSHQMHLLAHEFDPTQRGRVGRLLRGGPDVRYTSALLNRAIKG